MPRRSRADHGLPVEGRFSDGNQPVSGRRVLVFSRAHLSRTIAPVDRLKVDIYRNRLPRVSINISPHSALLDTTHTILIVRARTE